MEKQTESQAAAHRFELESRPDFLGGGWRLRLLEQEPEGPEIEVGGVSARACPPLRHGFS